MANLRKYGKAPYKVAVVHGGPGVPGEMAPVARELSSLCGVLEPLQTESTLDGQVEELKTILEEYGEPPILLIGWSHGAILSYILTARYSTIVRKLITVGTPSLGEKYADIIHNNRLLRLSEEEREEVFALEEFIWDSVDEDKSKSLARLFRLFAKADSYEPIPHRDEALEYQLGINISAGLDLRKILASGELLELGKKIKCPVLAIHGDYDLRPAEGVREPLSRVLKNFRFILLEKCGHTPWLERNARDRFYDILKKEIKQQNNEEHSQIRLSHPPAAGSQ